MNTTYRIFENFWLVFFEKLLDICLWYQLFIYQLTVQIDKTIKYNSVKWSNLGHLVLAFKILLKISHDPCLHAHTTLHELI